MTDFFRFPHTPHLAWLGEGSPRDDKVLMPHEVTALLAGDVVVEEKLDGANVGLSLALDGSLRAQNRGQYLGDPCAWQFSRLPAWLAQHGEALRSHLAPNLILFGEWCAARHALNYTALPDWFLFFDVYDRKASRFWSSVRRNALAEHAGLLTVPLLLRGRTTLADLKRMLATTSSRYRSGPLEGLVLRRESPEWCEARGKLVCPEFTQTMESHWRRRAIEWNQLDCAAGIAT
jgi:ATP-dependent RNA circularization protein (DNA/RNA ligase family)